MASEDISVLAPLDFPSGSNWGAKEVEAVRFKTEPEKQDFQSFTCEGTLSSGDAKVLARFSNVFEVPVGRYQDKEYIDAYTKHKAFYDQLTAVLEPKPMSDSPSKPPTRSEGRYNTSSPFTDQGLPKSPTAASLDLGSPDNSPTAGVSKRKVRIQTTTPPSRKVSRLSPGSTEAILPELLPEYLAGEASPGLSEGEQGVTMDQSLSTSHTSSGQLHPDFDNSSSTSNPEPGASSSQSSSFHSPSSPTLPLETRPDADLNVLENEVVELFLRFLDSICAEHDGRDGIKFTPDYGKDLVVMIDGSMVHTRPDLTVSVIFSGQKIQIPILDYEGKRLSGKPKFAQRVSEMLGRCCFQKARHYNKSSYRPYLISAHNTEMSISTCKLRDSYLENLNSDPKLLKSRELIQVTEYGPIDIREPENRVLAAQNVYKLMLQLAERARKDRVRG